MKIVIVGAGSVAFTPALLSGFGTDKRYQGATLGFVDVNEEVLGMVAKFARRASDELGMDWKIEASTDRKGCSARGGYRHDFDRRGWFRCLDVGCGHTLISMAISNP